MALKLKLGLATTIAGKEGLADVAAGLTELVEQTQSTVEAVRAIARGIFPPLLEAEGLRAAVAGAARLAPVPVAVHADGLDRYPREVESTVYFCVVEAIGNAAAHAHPHRVDVTIDAADGELAFTVADDGAGFDPAAPTAGTGLAHLADRLDVLGGSVAVTSTPGAGTTVTGRLPIAPCPGPPTAASLPTTAGARP